jgi:peptidoglycan/LPS O-acetylase OafA/YrhL
MVEVIKKNSNFSGRFYLLDIARAVAAICVVLHHYQHFYFVAPNIYQKNFSRSQQPFFEIIEPFYQFGSIAVQFFFVLSGFIFFFKYKDVISSKNISFKNFIILRISRLYPLHLFTLFFMVFIQFYYQRLNGEYYVYQDGNTLKNFILHFFLIQEWGFNSGWGFNAASWSISVEFLLYITFFYIALTGIKNLLQSLYILLLILILYCFMHPAIGNLMIGFLCFYIGGVTYFIYLKLHELINASFKKKLYKAERMAPCHHSL